MLSRKATWPAVLLLLATTATLAAEPPQSDVPLDVAGLIARFEAADVLPLVVRLQRVVEESRTRTAALRDDPTLSPDQLESALAELRDATRLQVLRIQADQARVDGSTTLERSLRTRIAGLEAEASTQSAGP